MLLKNYLGWCVLISSFCFGNEVLAQVNGRIDTYRDAQTDRTTYFHNWPLIEEQDWFKENSDQLEVMSVSVNLSSANFKTRNGEFSFELNNPRYAYSEYLIDVSKIQEGQSLQIKNKKNDQVLYTIDSDLKGFALTPILSNADVYWIWKSNDSHTEDPALTISYAYVHSNPRDIGFNTAMPCHQNAPCRTDSLSQTMASSTVRMRMVMEEGIGWCTGSLVNNTNEDRKPYLLSAYHCQYEFTPVYDAWRFDFFYESAACEIPSSEPSFQSLTGCERVALRQETDFLLVLLSDPIPSSFPVTFAGWNADELAIADSVFLIHHPNADIKKRSIANVPATVHPNSVNWTEGYTTPANHHFRVRFSKGGHQPGSSGGPVFNPAGQVIGQLHGGKFGCEEQSNTFVGRVAMSWNQGQDNETKLSPWLDPLGLGIKELNGLHNIDSNDLVTIRGQILDPFDRPVKYVTVTITGAGSYEVITDSTGNFEIPDVVPGGNYTITPKKDVFDANGVNVLDLVAIQSHLLDKKSFTHTWQLIAADANKSVAVSALDLIEIQKLLLGFNTEFPKVDSWRFIPTETILTNVNPDQLDPISIIAVKMGDVNGTSDPLK